jgi:hypothetical protein
MAARCGWATGRILNEEYLLFCATWGLIFSDAWSNLTLLCRIHIRRVPGFSAALVVRPRGVDSIPFDLAQDRLFAPGVPVLSHNQ